jgi:predicted dehydrogenase
VGLRYTAAVSAPHRIIVLGGQNKAALVKDVLDAGGFALVAAGSQVPDAAGALSAKYKVDRIDDVRAALLRDDADVLWIAEPVRGSASELWNSARDRSMRIVCTEPPFTAPSQIGDDAPAASKPEMVPRMLRSPGFRAAMEIVPQLGETLCADIAFRSGPAHGSLFARLFDGMEVMHALCGDVESVNAALAGPLPGVPESLSGLRGHLTINLRFKTNRCACAALSDNGGAWFRGVTILADGGCVRITDGGFVWHGPDGREIDSHRTPLASAPGAVIADQISRILSDVDATEPPTDHAAILALCEATRLSCLTGQNEAPARLLEMLSRP